MMALPVFVPFGFYSVMVGRDVAESHDGAVGDERVCSGRQVLLKACGRRGIKRARRPKIQGHVSGPARPFLSGRYSRMMTPVSTSPPMSTQATAGSSI